MSDTDGTGRAAHERHCPARASAAICKACHQDYPRGALDQHLKTCPASATAELGRAKPGATVSAPRTAVVGPNEFVVTLTISGDYAQLERARRKLGGA